MDTAERPLWVMRLLHSVRGRDGAARVLLPVSGDIPSEQATGAALLPGGVLFSDATTTWFGEAVTK